MAETRHFAGLEYGQIGRLSYKTTEHAREQPGSLRTSRLTSSYPHFSPIGVSAAIYPSSKAKLPPPTSSRKWIERNTQRRWLLKSHPEAFVADPIISGILGADASRFRKLEDGINPKHLLDVGTIIDYSIPSKPVNAPVIAAAAGESSELLRLARIEKTQWAWEEDGGEDEEGILNLSVVDSVDPDEELVWGTDALPITQVKFAVNGSRLTASMQWLLVQKQSGTMILQPEYHKVPRAVNQESSPRDRRATSRITANHLITISNSETGGNAHSDMSLSPSSAGRPAQLCIMDESGYWTIWSILGLVRTGISSVRCSLYKCGHIWEGTLNGIPSSPSYPAERHGVAFISDPALFDTPQDIESNSDNENDTNRTHYIVMWNPERVEVVDTEANPTSQKRETFSAVGGNYGRIIDVQINPLSPGEAYVLTTQFVLWVDLFVFDDGFVRVPKARIILASHHLATKCENLRMTAPQSSYRQGGDPSVLVYSSPDRQMSVHWFSRTKDDTMPQWHRQVVSLAPIMQDPEHSQGCQSINLQRAKLMGSRIKSQRLSDYRKRHVRFYECLILGEDLSLKHCMCFTSHDATFEIDLPTRRLKCTKVDQRRRWRRKRAHMLRSFAEVAVIPDQLTEVDLTHLVYHPHEAKNLPLTTGENQETEQTIAPAKLNFRRIANALDDALNATTSRDAGVPSVLMHGLLSVVQNGGFDGSLPLTTWLEIARSLQEDADSDMMEFAEFEEVLQDLLGDDHDQITFLNLGPKVHEDTQGIVSDSAISALAQRFSALWLDPTREKLGDAYVQCRSEWVAELARDVFLATRGVVIQDVPLFGELAPKASQQSREVRSSSINIRSSQPSSPNISSSPPLTLSSEPDAAFQRLELLAPGIKPGKVGALKEAAVLSYWPKERGLDTRDYLSSVAIASEQRFDGARQRARQREMKRKAFSEKYKLPESSRRAEPLSSQSRPRGDVKSIPIQAAAPIQIMSSQQGPSSSQTQGYGDVTMSQPVSGVFGDRKKSKKPKKRHGFR